jgi:hypothetical protein
VAAGRGGIALHTEAVVRHLVHAHDAAQAAVELTRGLLAAIEWWSVRDHEGDAPTPDCLDVFLLPLLGRVGETLREVDAALAAVRG